MAEDSLPKTRAEAMAIGAKFYFTGEPCVNGHIAKRIVTGRCTACYAGYRASHSSNRQPKIAALKAELGEAAVYYFSGEPCKNGHVAARLISTDTCVACLREHYRDRADKRRQYSRDYYAAHSQQQMATAKAYAARNPDVMAAIYQRQRDKITNNPVRAEAVRQQQNKFRQANPAKLAAWTRRRQAAQLQRTPKWLTPDDFAAMEVIYAEARRLTVETGIPHEVDHIIPLQGETVSGLHVPSNLQILTASQNRSKGHKHAV